MELIHFTVLHDTSEIRKRSNELIWCSRHISCYYQHLFEMEIFCNIMNVFTVTFDDLNASVVNKCIIYLKK